jgi:hypothetical protein
MRSTRVRIAGLVMLAMATVVAAAVLQLAGEGKLALEDGVERSPGASRSAPDALVTWYEVLTSSDRCCG